MLSLCCIPCIVCIVYHCTIIALAGRLFVALTQKQLVSHAGWANYATCILKVALVPQQDKI
jgi:hypothetical protein